MLCALLSGCSTQQSSPRRLSARLAPIPNSIEPAAAPILGEIVCPPKLCKDSLWKTAVNENGFLRLYVWDESLEVQKTPLQWDESIGMGGAFQGLVDGRFILGGMNTLHTGIKIAEFNPDGSLHSTGGFGDSRSRWGAYTPLADGGLAGAVYADPPSGQNKLIFDVYYRPKNLAWFSARWEFPPNTPSPIGMIFWATEGRDGLVWFFFTHDSSGAIGLMRMRPKILALPYPTGVLELVDFDANFIHVNRGDLSPSGELPTIYAVADADGILLGYQSFPYVETKCQYRKLHSRNSITRVRYDKSVTLLGTSEWWSPHIDFPLQAVFPRRDGIYYTMEFQGTQTCALGWNVGLFKNGVFSTSQVWPEGRITSLSPDGMVLFYNRQANTSEIIKLRFAPEMKIQRSGSSVIIDWDHASAGDLLEGSVNLKTWAPVTYGQRPAVLPATGPNRFFRVKTAP